MPVIKANSEIRLCGDYSDTVNPQLMVTQHSFPGHKEICGERFTTLDVHSAFLHLPVDDETSQILTINASKGLFRTTRLMYGISSAPAIW